MSGARILAIGGIVSAALTMLGGWLLQPTLLALAGATMLGANFVVLARRGDS